jgi:transcriptional regulator with XRE-family HTH domain
MLGWSQDELAAQSTVAKPTIAGFEAGRRQPYARTLADIRRALEGAGITFIAEGEASPSGGPGVRLGAGAAGAAED